MKDAIESVNEIASSKPIFTGVIGTVIGWGTALVAYIDAANKILAFVGTFAGTVAAIYTMLIVIRRYHLGVKSDEHKKN